MMDKITEEQFKRVVIKRDKKREKNQSCLHIYETLVTMFTERINAYVVDQNLSIEVDQNLSIENLENTLDELIQIRIFIQEQFTRVSKNYNMTVECFGTYSRLNSAKNVFTVCKRKLV